jgi:Uma2 family endonuclease
MEPITISFRHVEGFTDDEFYYFCQDNPDLTFERDAEGQLILMPNTGGKTGRTNARLNYYLTDWSLKTNLGETFDSSTTFRLPNTAMRSPDAAWVSRERWESLTEKEQQQFPPLCPDFVVELRSQTDLLKNLKQKMEEWMANGCQLGWLIDPKERKAYVYRPDQPAEEIDFENSPLRGEAVLPGFELDLKALA